MSAFSATGDDALKLNCSEYDCHSLPRLKDACHYDICIQCLGHARLPLPNRKLSLDKTKQMYKKRVQWGYLNHFVLEFFLKVVCVMGLSLCDLSVLV